MYEQSLCNGCGHPRSRAFNPDMEGYYDVVEQLCQACAVLEREQAERRQPGSKRAVRDDSYDDAFEPNPKYLAATRALTGARPPRPDDP